MKSFPGVVWKFSAQARLFVALGIVGLLCAWGLFASATANASVQDSFAGAFDLTSALSASPSTFSDTGTDVSTYTRDAVEVNGLSVCGNYPNTPANTYSVWYTYTAPSGGGWLTLSTLAPATNYDTVLEVWQGSVGAANSIACNDDAVSGDRRSELTLPVSAGAHYIVAIRRYGSSAMTSPQLAFNAHFSAAREVFVDQVTGNDSNTGSQALPYRTIGRATSALPAAGGAITVLDASVYNEAVSIAVPTTLNAPNGAVSIASVRLSASPIALVGAVSADSVLVQPGAKVQEAIGLAATGGTVALSDGDYAEQVTIGKDLTLSAVNPGMASLAPASGSAVTLTGGTVTITGLDLQADTGVTITGGSGHVISHNNIFGNTTHIGVDNQTGAQVNAALNWWGDRAGPPADGDDAVGNLIYRPWCASAIPDCATQLGAATMLQFSSSPADTMANAAFADQPVVEAVDDEGNLDSSFTGAVTLAIKAGTGTAGATLGGSVTMSAVAGVADFSGKGLNIDYVGQDYQLAATSGALSSTAAGDSSPFTISADRLVVTASPANPTAAGVPLALTVVAQDGAGNTDATFGGDITLAIASNPTGATIQGDATKGANAGSVTFGTSGDAYIALIGSGYTLRASSGALATSDSSPFDIVGGAPVKLVFSTSPSNSTAGSAFAAQPSVRVEDGFGNIDTSFNGQISLAITGGAGTTGATLNGTTSMNAVGGVAQFGGLSIATAGKQYRLTATSNSLISADSAAFDISAAAATQLVFTHSPGNTQAGAAFSSQPAVEARDQYDNLADSFSGAVALTIKAGTGTPSAALGGTATLNAVGGVASFSGLSINKAGTAYRLTATSAALTADSNPFTITANGLAFVVQPTTTAAGQPINVQVAARDLAGNVDTTFSGAVTLVLKDAIRIGPTLLGNTTVNAVNGVANFAAQGLNIQQAGAGYELTAQATGFPAVDSAAFDIVAGPATKLAFTGSPANTPAGSALTAAIAAQDAFGNLDTSFNGVVGLSIQTNPGGGALGGTVSKSASAGVASFAAADGVTIDKFGIGYVLSASSGALQPASSAAFNITANRLVFSQAPGTTGVGTPFAAQPVVRAEDGFGTLDTTYTGTVTLAIASGTGTAGATLRGTAGLAAVNGIVSYTGVKIDRMGTSYRLDASASGMAGATSPAFDIGKQSIFLPTMIVPIYADLVGSFTMSKPTFNPFDPVLITVTITNTGDAPASDFWVDFYVNPQVAPTAANQPWDRSCGTLRCRFGIAWYVSGTIAPGQSIKLFSTPSSYFANNTDWPGRFETDKLNLYLYVDSWNPGVVNGAVVEKNESNNRAELHLGGALAAAPEPEAAQAAPQTLPALPNRPVRPSETH